MPSAMVASNVLDSSEWPSLGGLASPAPPRCASDATKPSVVHAGVEGEGDGNHDDSDWENLQPLSPPPPMNQRPRSVSVFSNVAMVERGNRPQLRHCASSPDLRRLHNLEGIGEDEDGDEDDEEYDVINNDSESLSYAMLSGPGSVITMPSVGFSFRDAILSPGVGVGTIREESPSPLSPSAGKHIGARPIPTTEPRKPRSRPKFVVKPIKRCSKSMGDLRSLAADNDGDDDDEAMGATDAMDFYHRKALGAKGRANGLKIRPDELKRKQFTLQRKEMQRQGQS